MRNPWFSGFAIAVLWLTAAHLTAQSEVLGVELERPEGREVVRVRTAGAVSYSAHPQPGGGGFVIELLNADYSAGSSLTELAGQLVTSVEISRSEERGAVSTVVALRLDGARVPRILRSTGGLELHFDLASGAGPRLVSDKYAVRPPAAVAQRAASKAVVIDRSRDRQPADDASKQGSAVLLVEGARDSVRRAPRYDGSFRKLAFPGGDPGWEGGTGADLIVRAFRHADIDLQERLYRDIARESAAYGVEAPNPDIDHRRLANLARFFSRHADLAEDWQAGDLVFWARDGGNRPDHVGVVTDQRGRGGRPLVVHHPRDSTPVEADVLLAWPVLAHYRWPPG